MIRKNARVSEKPEVTRPTEVGVVGVCDVYTTVARVYIDALCTVKPSYTKIRVVSGPQRSRSGRGREVFG